MYWKYWWEPGKHCRIWKYESREVNDSDTISDKANGSQLYICTNNDENGFFKLTKLNYATLYPSDFEKQKVSLAVKVFSEKTNSFRVKL